MTTPALFELPEQPAAAAAEDAPKLSAGTRLKQRQAAAIARGIHPLGLVRPHLAIHPDAQPFPATQANADQRPIRCGTCIFRNPGQFAKCEFGPVIRTRKWPDSREYTWREFPRAAHSLATDIRSWWPGCTDWKAKP